MIVNSLTRQNWIKETDSSANALFFFSGTAVIRTNLSVNTGQQSVTGTLFRHVP